jgi:hypothetical protein
MAAWRFTDVTCHSNAAPNPAAATAPEGRHACTRSAATIKEAATPNIIHVPT